MSYVIHKNVNRQNSTSRKSSHVMTGKKNSNMNIRNTNCAFILYTYLIYSR